MTKSNEISNTPSATNLPTPPPRPFSKKILARDRHYFVIFALVFLFFFSETTINRINHNKKTTNGLQFVAHAYSTSTGGGRVTTVMNIDASAMAKNNDEIMTTRKRFVVGAGTLFGVAWQRITKRKTATTTTTDEEDSLFANQERHTLFDSIIGKTFVKSIKIPFLGHQRFQIQILDEKRGHLIIDGKVMNIDQVMDYTFDGETGQFSFDMPENVKKILKRLKTSIVDARFLKEEDTIHLNVSPPLPTNILIKLDKQSAK